MDCERQEAIDRLAAQCDEGDPTWERFQQLGQRVLAVSPEEMERREAAYKAEGKHKPAKPGRPRKSTVGAHI